MTNIDRNPGVQFAQHRAVNNANNDGAVMGQHQVRAGNGQDAPSRGSSTLDNVGKFFTSVGNFFKGIGKSISETASNVKSFFFPTPAQTAKKMFSAAFDQQISSPGTYFRENTDTTRAIVGIFNNHVEQMKPTAHSIVEEMRSHPHFDDLCKDIGYGRTNESNEEHALKQNGKADAIITLASRIVDVMFGADGTDGAALNLVPSDYKDLIRDMSNAVMEHGGTNAEQKNEVLDKSYSSFVMLRAVMPLLTTDSHQTAPDKPTQKAGNLVMDLLQKVCNGASGETATGMWSGSPELSQKFDNFAASLRPKLENFYTELGMPHA